MNRQAIISKIQNLRTMAQMMDKEATSLEELLADVSTPAVRKGLSNQQIETVLMKRRKSILKKQSRQL